MKKDPLWRNSPENTPGEVQAACSAASAPRLWPISTGATGLGQVFARNGTTWSTRVAAYAGLAAYRSLRAPGASRATRIRGRRPAAIAAPT